MAENLGISNAIGWAHLQLRGGWKNLLITTSAYAVLIGTVILISLRLDPSRSSSLLWGWTIGLLGLQVAIFLLFGCTTVNAAVRLDHTSNMIESHRLMPTPPSLAILGYLFGAPCQAITLAVATFLLGILTASGGGVSFERWAIPNAILAMFAIFLWSGIIFFGLLTKKGTAWAFIFVMATWFSQGSLLVLLPGLTVLVSPIIGDTIFGMRTRNAQFTWEYAVAIAAQVLIGLILFVGASRKYRRADVQALGTFLSLLLVAAWTAISGVAIAYWGGFEPRFFGRMNVSQDVQFVCSLGSILLLAIAPVASAAWATAEWQRHRDLDDPSLGRRPLPMPLAALLAAIIAIGFTAIAPAPPKLSIDEARWRIAVSAATFLLGTGYVLQRRYRVQARPAWLLAGIWLFVTWVLPLIIDFVRHGLEGFEGDVLGPISACSPIGLLTQLWSRRPADTNFGLTVQGLVAIGMAVWFHVTRSRAAAGD